MRKVPPTYRRVAKMTGAELMTALKQPQQALNVKAVVMAEIEMRLDGLLRKR